MRRIAHRKAPTRRFVPWNTAHQAERYVRAQSQPKTGAELAAKQMEVGAQIARLEAFGTDTSVQRALAELIGRCAAMTPTAIRQQRQALVAALTPAEWRALVRRPRRVVPEPLRTTLAMITILTWALGEPPLQGKEKPRA
jgi:hypothetical protein